MQRGTKLKRLGLGLGTTAALLVGAELVLRLILGTPPPPPRAKPVLARPDVDLLVEDGMARSHPDSRAVFPLQAPWPQVAVLGGSSVHGGTPGVDYSGEFAALGGDWAEVDVANAGWPGQDSYHVLAQARTLAEADYDVIVAYTGHNDFGNIRFRKAFDSPLSLYLAQARLSLSRFQLFRQLTNLTHGFRAEGGPDNALPLLSHRDFRRALAGLEDNLRELVRTCQEHQVPLVLVTPLRSLTAQPEEQPCDWGGECPIDLYERAMSLASSDPQAAGRLLEQARDADRRALSAPSDVVELIRDLDQEEGVTVLDAVARMPREPGVDVAAQRMFSDPIHLSAQGHQELGALLGATLRGMVWEECRQQE